jgi:hypothetical protein
MWLSVITRSIRVIPAIVKNLAARAMKLAQVEPFSSGRISE